jgi:pimeloyl-ACP methyl ester carboxylesterase
MAALLFFSLRPPVAAAPGCACGRSPVIILPGYSGPQLFLDVGLETERQIWSPQINGESVRSVADALVNILPRMILDAGGNADQVVARFGEVYDALLEKMEMNGDGTSKHNVTPVPQHARNCRWDVMLERGQERLNIAQRSSTNSMLEHISADHVYVFANDWRMGQVEGARALRGFIEEVRADSGHDTVSFYGVSYGGQLAAAYFTFYGGKGIDLAVLHAPAIRGSSLTVDILEDPAFVFDPAMLLDFAAVFMERELSLGQRLEGASMELVSGIAVKIIRAYLTPLFKNFGSFWDIVPPEDYDRLKAKHLDPVANAEIIRRSDIVHYEMMPNIGETLRRVQGQGVKIALIVGTGLPLAGGNPVDSDAIIDVASTTGALPLGAVPPVDTPADPVCHNKDHPHRSPDGRIDANCAYLPEHTWFFRGQYHGQAAWDLYARQLYCKWLFTDDIQDVWSDPAFPQFRDSCNPSDGLEARFSGSVSGYLAAGDETLLLRNLSAYDISLLSVRAEGLEFDVPILGRVTVRPGETARLRYETILPAEARCFGLTVEFIRESPVPAREHRSFLFTALPAREDIPQVLRFPGGEPPPSPLRLRPARFLLVFPALAASLVLATVAVWVMLRKGLREG